MTPFLVRIEIYRPETKKLVAISRSLMQPLVTCQGRMIHMWLNRRLAQLEEGGNGKDEMVGCRSEMK